MESAKLKQCPFCGDQAVLKRDRIGEGIRNSEVWYQVECQNERCSIQPFTDWHKSRSVVVREWNRRVTDDEI